MTSRLGASHQWFVQIWFPEGATVTPSPKRDAARFFLVFGSLESSSSGFALSTKTTAGFNAPAKGMRWRILAADLFSQVSAIFPRTSSHWNRRDMELSSCTSSVWAPDQRHCEGRIGGCCYLDNIHVSTAPALHRPSTCFLRWLSCVTFTLCHRWKNYRRYERQTRFLTVCVSGSALRSLSIL